MVFVGSRLKTRAPDCPLRTFLVLGIQISAKLGKDYICRSQFLDLNVAIFHSVMHLLTKSATIVEYMWSIISQIEAGSELEIQKNLE